MLLIIGTVVVLGCVLGGYAAMGGHLDVLWQPFEFVIIVGAAVGAYIIANPVSVLKSTGSAFLAVIKGPRHKKDSYIELLGMLFTLFRLERGKGSLALEPHVENPHKSTLFAQFPGFHANHHAVTFLCDYLRLITLGTGNVHELDALMDEELETHHQEDQRLSNALQTVADGMPALGIVAAVLGIIKTMGSITEPPEVLGHLIGGALVGTFLGVFIAYGFIGPLASALRNTQESEARYFQCIKAGLLAHVQGYAPAVSVEFARKALMSDVRPTFHEVEAAMGDLQPATA